MTISELMQAAKPGMRFSRASCPQRSYMLSEHEKPRPRVYLVCTEFGESAPVFSDDHADDWELVTEPADASDRPGSN